MLRQRISVPRPWWLADGLPTVYVWSSVGEEKRQRQGIVARYRAAPGARDGGCALAVTVAACEGCGEEEKWA